MRLAHFSDIHLTVPPLSARGRLFGKRLAGTVNYYVGGRGRHFRGVEHRIERLLADVDAAGVDHVLCTGDLTQMSWRAEFDRLAGLFGARLYQPERYTVIPGNHDRYTREAVLEDRFGQHFGALAAPGAEYPALKWLDGGRVALVLLDVARPTGLLDSSGWCGAAQLARLEAILTDPSLDRAFVVLALHYGLFRADGRPDRPTHRIRDFADLLALLSRPEAKVDLILHGHMHRSYVVRSHRRTLVCAGSPTDLTASGGWLLFDIDPDTRRFGIARRSWSAEADAFLPNPEPLPGWSEPRDRRVLEEAPKRPSARIVG